MNRIIQFAVFISIFLLVYVGLNFYTVMKVGKLLGVENKHWLYAIIILVTLAIPASVLVEKFAPNMLARALYTISTLWMGVLLFLFSSLVVYEILALFLRMNPKTAGIIIVIVTVVLSIVSVVNAFLLHVELVDVPIDGLKKEMNIVQLSDVHMGTVRNSAFLNKIVERTNELNPDIVMITGDLVDGSAPLHKSMFSAVNSINAPIFFVSGNHETYEGVEKVYELFKDTKIRVLKNEVVQLDGVQVVGINFSTDSGNLKKQLAGIKMNSSKPTILMHHDPIDMKDAKDAGIDLQLSGHTHYGQIFPFNFAVKLARPYIKGLYDFGGMQLYVSPGTGTWGPYMRLGSMNEITLLRLKKG